MESNDLTWIDPAVIPDAAHLLHHSDVWCPVNAEGRVAVYKMGTKPNDANALQGNRHKVMALKFLNNYRQYGAVEVRRFEHVFIPDSPGRY